MNDLLKKLDAAHDSNFFTQLGMIKRGEKTWERAAETVEDLKRVVAELRRAGFRPEVDGNIIRVSQRATRRKKVVRKGKLKKFSHAHEREKAKPFHGMNPAAYYKKKLVLKRNAKKANTAAAKAKRSRSMAQRHARGMDGVTMPSKQFTMAEAMRRLDEPFIVSDEVRDEIMHMYLNDGSYEDLSDGAKDAMRKATKWASKIVKGINKGLKQEKDETKEMVATFFRLLKQKLGKIEPPDWVPTDDEVKAAIRQLKDVGRVALVAAAVINPLPGDVLLLITLEKVARHWGVTFLPSAMQGLI